MVPSTNHPDSEWIGGVRGQQTYQGRGQEDQEKCWQSLLFHLMWLELVVIDR